jgi:hypothetical protein
MLGEFSGPFGISEGLDDYASITSNPSSLISESLISESLISESLNP